MLGKIFTRQGQNKENLRVEMKLEDKLNASFLPKEERFNNILKFAKQVIDESSISNSSKHPIFDVIRILGRSIQSDYLKYVMFYECEDRSHYIPNLNWSTVGFDENTNFIDSNGEIISFRNFKREVKCSKKLSLSKDLILPWPWKRSRLINTIGKIGEERNWGMWKQHNNNHFVQVWLPFGIAWVNGGNHSIAVGIIQGGELVPDHYYDISEVYKHIKCDGKNYLRTRTNGIINEKIICPVNNVEFAAIFEIGRLLVERGISFADN